MAFMGNEKRVTEWLQAIGVDISQPVHRVVIDVQVNKVVQIYIEQHADERLITAGIPEELLVAVQEAKGGEGD